MLAEASVTDSASHRPRALHYGAALAMIIALVIGLAALYIAQQQEHYRERALLSTQNTARLLHQTISGIFDKIDVVLQSVVGYYQEDIGDGSLNTAKLGAYLARSKASLPEVLNIRIVDTQGVVRYGREASTPPFNVGDRDYFIGLRDDATASLFVSGPLFGRGRGQWVIVLARRLAAADGSFAGVVYASVSTAHFEGVLSSIALGPHGAATLRTSDLALVHRYPDTKKAVGSKTVSQELHDIMHSQSSAGAYIATTALDGIERSNAYSRLKRYPFYVIVGQATDDYRGEAKHNVVALLLLTLLALLFPSLATLLAYRSAQRAAVEVDLRRASEEDLRRALQEQQTMLNTDVVGIVKVRDRHFVWANAAFARMLRYPVDALIGQATRKVYTSDQAHAAFGRDAYSSIEHGNIYHGEIQYLRQDGSLGWYEISGGLLAPGSAETIWAFVDISEKKAIALALAESTTRNASILAAMAEEQASLLRALAGDLLRAEQRERDRLYGLLHDDVQPLLVAARLALGSLGAGTPAGEVVQVAADAASQITQVIAVARNLSLQLSPPLIREAGLIPALESLFRWVKIHHGVQVDLITSLEIGPDDLGLRLLCFHAVRELLLNVAKHASTQQATVRLQQDESGILQLSVADPGKGFDPDSCLLDGSGLAAIRRRLRMLGGSLEIASQPAGGTVVTLSVPLSAVNQEQGDAENTDSR
jgi:PAS domain S-box-containing protein